MPRNDRQKAYQLELDLTGLGNWLYGDANHLNEFENAQSWLRWYRAFQEEMAEFEHLSYWHAIDLLRWARNEEWQLSEQMMRTCKNQKCRKKFIPSDPRRQTCSNSCKTALWRQQVKLQADLIVEYLRNNAATLDEALQALDIRLTESLKAELKLNKYT